MAGDVLLDRDGALADERDGHRVGAHALARDAAGGVGGVDEVGGNMMTGSCGAAGAHGGVRLNSPPAILP
jgi:hypothetical protein